MIIYKNRRNKSSLTCSKNFDFKANYSLNITEYYIQINLLKDDSFVAHIAQGSNVFITTAGIFNVRKGQCTFFGKARVHCYGTSAVSARNDVFVKAFDESTVSANDHAHVRAYDKSNINYRNNAYGLVYDDAKAHVSDQCIVEFFNNAIGRCYNSSVITLHKHSSCVSFGNARVRALDESYVMASDNSDIIALQKVRVSAYGNTTCSAGDDVIVKSFGQAQISAGGNAVVYATEQSIIHAYRKATINLSGFSILYTHSSLITINRSSHFGAVITPIVTVTEDVLVYKKLLGGYICTLKLLQGQTFQCERYNKCRTSFAYVEKIESISKPADIITTGVSSYDTNFVYAVGTTVSTKYNPMINECSDGIHFFLTKQEAIDY